MADSVPIPEPPGLPLLGNLGEFSSSPIDDVVRLANTYGKTNESAYFCLLFLSPSAIFAFIYFMHTHYMYMYLWCFICPYLLGYYTVPWHLRQFHLSTIDTPYLLIDIPYSTSNYIHHYYAIFINLLE